MSEPVLTVRNLQVEYRSDRGPVRAVDDVSFELRPGEALSLVGESGSGKTTLAMALLRLLPDGTSVKGMIGFHQADGRVIDLSRLRPRQLRGFRWSECAMVFQSAQSAFNPVMRIEDHFQETWSAHRTAGGQVARGELRQRMAGVLREVRLDAERVLPAYPHQLSGGMRQRVLLALSLLLRPRVIVFDEPTTGLDVITQRGVIEMIRRLQRELGFALIFVTHDLALAAELSDRVATMYGGRIVEIGDVEPVFYHPRHPYTVGLLRSIPTLSSEREHLVPIDGSPPDLVGAVSGCIFRPRCVYATDECEQRRPALTATGTTAAACWHTSAVAADWEAARSAG